MAKVGEATRRHRLGVFATGTEAELAYHRLVEAGFDPAKVSLFVRAIEHWNNGLNGRQPIGPCVAAVRQARRSAASEGF